jgi:hypothetical protein
VLGAIAGGYLSVVLYKRHLGIERPTGDLFAVALCAGEAIGRWGCFFGGCCYGKPSHAAWAVWQHGAWRHPTQIYLSLASLLILGCLLLLERTDPRENALFYFQGLLYCVSRFVIEFFRATRRAVGLRRRLRLFHDHAHALDAPERDCSLWSPLRPARIAIKLRASALRSVPTAARRCRPSRRRQSGRPRRSEARRRSRPCRNS